MAYDRKDTVYTKSELKNTQTWVFKTTDVPFIIEALDMAAKQTREDGERTGETQADIDAADIKANRFANIAADMRANIED